MQQAQNNNASLGSYTKKIVIYYLKCTGKWALIIFIGLFSVAFAGLAMVTLLSGALALAGEALIPGFSVFLLYASQAIGTLTGSLILGAIVSHLIIAAISALIALIIFKFCQKLSKKEIKKPKKPPQVPPQTPQIGPQPGNQRSICEKLEKREERDSNLVKNNIEENNLNSSKSGNFQQKGSNTI